MEIEVPDGKYISTLIIEEVVAGNNSFFIKVHKTKPIIVHKIKDKKVLATIENNHYESGENHQKKSKRKSHYYNNSKGSTIVLANNAQKIGANE